MKFVYPAIVKPKSDGGYLVTFPALDKCQAEGSTLEEAIERAKEAEATWISVEMEDSTELPIPDAIDESALEEGCFVRSISAIVKFVEDYDS